jgi:flagellar biosynthesis component FlhA
MSRLLRRGLPRLSVISYAEIPADKTVQVSVQMQTGENP